MKKVFLSISALFLLLISFSSVIPVEAGSFFNPPAVAEPGTWYMGATPENLNPAYPVLLFVQGLNSSSHTWYENNDMYQTAFNNGYQTAFVELYDSGGTPEDMWDNGALLAEKIGEISQTFHKPIALITHSKGGIDAEAALVHYGAYPYVTNVVTLSSPHYGSQLADLAYSSWAGWLAGILGAKSDATYSLQTSYMSYFRSVTDSHPNAGRNPFYTLAGTSWGSFGSSLYWGGLYLSQFGPNDGAVTVNNAYHPNSSMIKVGNWNHTNIKYGSSTFAWFRSYLSGSTPSSSSLSASALSSSEQYAASQLIRGGSTKGTAREKIWVENGVERLTIDWISNQELRSINLLTPDGEKQEVFPERVQDDQIFKGAWHHTFTIPKPAKGEWQLESDTPSSSAYLMLVQFTSPLSDKIKVKKDKKAGKLSLLFDTKTKGKASYTLDFTPLHNNKGKKIGQRLKEKFPLQGDQNLTIQGKTPGVYTYTIEVEGKTDEGVPYQRTFIQSVFVDDQGKMY